MLDPFDNGPIARAKSAIDRDCVTELSQIPDLQSWCSLSVNGSIKIFDREFSNPTITQYAAYNGKSECLYFILRRCPDVLDVSTDSQNSNISQIALPYPYSLLHLTILSGNLECVKTVIKFSLLSSSNEDFINNKDNLGFTALHFVSLIGLNNDKVDSNSKQEIAKELLRNGADLFAENCMCETPLISSLVRDSDLFEFYCNYLIQEGKKDVLEKFVTEKKYKGADGSSKNIVQFFETEPKPYASLKKLHDLLLQKE